MHNDNVELPSKRFRVALFVTCLVDLFRPTVAFAAIKLLKDASCEVSVPERQVCCGQPAYNSGDVAGSRALAMQMIECFEGFDYVVGPSGSCMATIRCEYPKLFEGDPIWQEKAQALAQRSYELISFLVDVLGVTQVGAKLEGKVTYHDSCSGLRSLGIKSQPRTLLGTVEGLSLAEMQDAETCCGFGGTFCVKYPEISVRLADDKIGNIRTTSASYLAGGDLGCLMNIAGRLSRVGSDVSVYHVAEILAGLEEQRAICEPEEDR
jgi:L-lactate dehydrogenase complex protein LldE